HLAGPDGELRAQIEGRLLARLERLAVGVRDAGAAHEEELSAAQVDDAGVLLRDAVAREHDVAGGQAADGEVLLAEAGDHAELFTTNGAGGQGHGHRSPGRRGSDRA